MPTHHKKTVRTEIVHTSVHFSKNVRNIFKICSYIQKTTTNPINALKAAIYDTKHTNNTQIHFEKSENFEKCQQSHF